MRFWQSSFGELRSGGEMQVGEERLALLQQAVLGWQRLLDLEHELRLAPDGFAARRTSRAPAAAYSASVKPADRPAPFSTRTSAPSFTHAPAKVGRHRDAGFAVLDLFRNTYRHDLIMRRAAELATGRNAHSTAAANAPAPTPRANPVCHLLDDNDSADRPLHFRAVQIWTYSNRLSSIR
jgi:hypothetical protein